MFKPIQDSTVMFIDPGFSPGAQTLRIAFVSLRGYQSPRALEELFNTLQTSWKDATKVELFFSQFTGRVVEFLWTNFCGSIIGPPPVQHRANLFGNLYPPTVTNTLQAQSPHTWTQPPVSVLATYSNEESTWIFAIAEDHPEWHTKETFPYEELFGEWNAVEAPISETSSA